MDLMDRAKLIEEIKRYLYELKMINDQIIVYSLIAECKNDDACLGKLNIAPVFFTVTVHSLTSSILLAVARLYDIDSSEKTIIKLINMCKVNANLFDITKVHGYIDETNQEVETKVIYRSNFGDFIEEIESRYLEIKHSEQLKKIKTLRDKIFAHNDKKYFIDQSEAPVINVDEVNNIIESTYKTLSDLLLYLNGELFSPKSENSNDFIKLIESIQIKTR